MKPKNKSIQYLDKKTIEKLQNYNYNGKISKLVEKIDNDYKEAKQLSDIMRKEISNNPGNIREALRSVSKKTGVGYGTLVARYWSKKPFKAYSEYFPDPCNRYNMETAYYVIGEGGQLSNTKNTNDKKLYMKNRFVFFLLNRFLKL